MTSKVRIIGGKYRGKMLSFPNQTDLRPTPSRVRETVFNWLMHDIRNADCLDAFAGSGALGFEAYSRGAKSVTLLEAAKETFLCLKASAKDFDTSALKIIHTKAESFLEKSRDTYNIIFLDPPFKDPNTLMNCINLIAQAKLLKPNGMLYTESPKPIQLPHDIWETHREKTTGDVTYALHVNLEFK